MIKYVIFDIQENPLFYIQNHTRYSIKAYTIGIYSPPIIIDMHDHAIDPLDESELLALIGHELGCIKVDMFSNV